MDLPNIKWPCRLPTPQACKYEMGFNESVFSCWGKWMLEFKIVSWTACSRPPDHQIHQAKSWHLWGFETVTLFSFKKPWSGLVWDKIWPFDSWHWEFSTDFHSTFKGERTKGGAQTTEENFLLFLFSFWNSTSDHLFQLLERSHKSFALVIWTIITTHIGMVFPSLTPLKNCL